jgi:hypothetical protein
MKYFKFILALLLVLPLISLAQWNAPSSGPTGNNTPPPINVGSVNQVKNGVITANGLCVKFSGNITRCLGADGAGNTYAFPWIQNGINLETTNPSDGEVWINPNRIRANNTGNGIWSSDSPQTQALTVGGKIKAEGFCLGAECYSDWASARAGTGGGTAGPTFISGTGTVNRIIKFTSSSVIGNSSLFESTAGGVSKLKSDIVFDTTGAVNASGVPTGDGGGFIIERRTTNPANAEEGRMWLCVDEGSDCK